MRVVRQSLSCWGMCLARRKRLKAFARHTGSHERRCDTFIPSGPADRNLLRENWVQDILRVLGTFGSKGRCVYAGTLTQSLSQSGLCGIDGATYITEGLILNKVGRNSFWVTLEELLPTHYCRRPSHPPGAYGVHPLGPDPIPARLASHRDVLGMVCSDPRSPSASEKSHTPESALVP
ncbi:hypothetical protein T01_13650 [Trichinella spiralis]|uniref:Uncharacterized protein n=1 Tax=Trichinella spiralis TaxID=6334 RepID=A0A0V1BWV1_TRISP|nr:hypothetical protein T01_13650 [Trichinella spiralis]